MTEHLREHGFLLKLRDCPAAADFLPKRHLVSPAERAVDIRISRIALEIGRSRIEESVEHIVAAVLRFLHHPGLNHAVVIHQIVKRNGKTGLRSAGRVHHEFIGGVVAEDLIACRPVVDFLAARENPF